MKTVTEKTLVPISLVIALSGGMYKFSGLSFATERNEKDIADARKALSDTAENLAEQLEKQTQILSDIRAQNAAIEARLQSLSEFVKAEKRKLHTRED